MYYLLFKITTRSVWAQANGRTLLFGEHSLLDISETRLLLFRIFGHLMQPDLSSHLHTAECNFLIKLLEECRQESTFSKRCF